MIKLKQMRKEECNLRIAVGGMIAAGKSTLVKNLSKELNVPMMQEFPEDDPVFNTMLEWLYSGVEDVEMLLQTYFIHNQYKTQLKHTGNLIIDRDLIEHWVFAHNNLKQDPKVMNMYNTLFHAYMNEIKKPDLYIILTNTWSEFKQRIHDRGRASEIENWDDNEEYFYDLFNTYEEKLVAQCVIHGIPYIIIDTTGMTEEETLGRALHHITVHQSTKE